MPITQMLDDHTLISSQRKLETHILTFYEALYSRDKQVENNAEVQEDCFSYLKQTITEDHNKELLRPLTVEEVSNTMKQLPTGKAPGMDSIPADFYHELWEDIKSDIFNFVSKTVTQAFITAKVNINKIALLPKTEDMLRAQNFKHVSFFNTLYKVAAKVYANRMKPLLHCWILPSQTGFVPNICILDNIFLAFETVEWTLENKQDLNMLLLDFEEAYDKVNWTFLRQAMGRMGFISTWINQMQ